MRYWSRFFTRQSRAGAVPGGGQRWTAAQLGELDRMVLEVAAEFKGRGVTGHPLLWRQERNRIAADLQLLLGDDELLRAQTGRVQVRSELSFGIREHPAVRVRLADGREIWFRGSADRVDRAGTALVVVDYKTGSPKRFKMDIHTKVRGRFCSTSKEAERKPARCRVLSGLLDKLGWHAVTGRRLGVVMTVQRHDRPHPHIERTFIAVRAALPAANVAAFDTELEAITHAPVVDLAALDEFLSGWWRIATRAAADPADWQRMHQEAEQLQSGARSAGPTLAEVLGRRGVQL